MKKLLIACGVAALLLTVLFSRAQTRTAWNIIYVTNGSTTVPTNFTAGVNATTNIRATIVTILGKPSPRGVNTSIAYIGTTNVNDSQPYPVPIGGEVIMRTARPNEYYNLAEWWVDVGTVNDGITILYQ